MDQPRTGAAAPLARCSAVVSSSGVVETAARDAAPIVSEQGVVAGERIDH
jgi:hypothetical protein